MSKRVLLDLIRRLEALERARDLTGWVSLAPEPQTRARPEVPMNADLTTALVLIAIIWLGVYALSSRP